MSDISLVHFDFDNTLARLEPVVDWAASRRELEPMMRRAGAPDPLFEKFPKGNLMLYDAYRAHLAAMVRKDGGEHAAILRQASEIIEKFELQGVDRAEPLEGAVKLVRKLVQAGKKVGIVTSNSSKTVTRWLKKHGLDGIVSLVVGRDSLLPLKPAPDMIEKALAIAEVPRARACYVGDTVGDCAAATEAGIPFFGIAGSDAVREALLSKGAVKVFSSPAEVSID